MFKQDSFIFGLFIGAFLPLMAYIFFALVRQEIELYAKESLIYIFCIGANAIIFRLMIKQEKDNLAKGVLLVTFVYAFLFFWYKMH